MAKTPGALMRAARERAGKTQQQIAEELGFTQAFVAAWEAGKRVPSTRDLVRVAKAYGLKPQQLIPAQAS